ncbi:MAG: hypothetical protein WB615_05265 [Candidatus Tumulicola sp.]
MKILSIGLALALPAIVGCGQQLNQSSLPSGGAQSMHSAASLGRVHPDNCNYKSQGTSSSGGFLRWKLCSGYSARMTYGPGTTGNLKISTQPSITNPGGVPVPAGETPVLFVQQQVLPQDPGPATFTAPMVPPATNKSRILGVPAGTYKLYVYNSSGMLLFSINLGAPSAGTLLFNALPHSPLPLLGTLPVGTVTSFELVTP